MPTLAPLLATTENLKNEEQPLHEGGHDHEPQHDGARLRLSHRQRHGGPGRRQCQRQEKGGRGRPGAHLAFPLHTLQSGPTPHHLVRQLAHLRVDHHHYHHRQLRRHGPRRQATPRRQDRPVYSNG